MLRSRWWRIERKTLRCYEWSSKRATLRCEECQREARSKETRHWRAYLMVVEENKPAAFQGGENTGDVFPEYAGYGEHLVELSTDLEVRAASHPDDIVALHDLDFSAPRSYSSGAAAASSSPPPTGTVVCISGGPLRSPPRRSAPSRSGVWSSGGRC